ncbi:MAG: holin [Calditrichaeota bacterium]|nr:MAG: holin [Calditrichota bacterium]
MRIKAMFTILGGFLGWFFGGLDGFLYALITLVVLDYLTGVALAIYNKELSSSIDAKGIVKKLLIFALVGVGNIFDMYLIENGGAIRTAVIFFYISNESISILENVSKTNLPIPEFLKSVLESYKGKYRDK